MTINALTLKLASADLFDVREFTVEEGLSRLFDVRLTAMSASADVDFEAAIGGPARFEILRTSPVDGETRHWNGICVRLEQVRAEEAGLSTYAIRIAPVMWLLTQRRNYRIFQDKSELDVALEVLTDWGLNPTHHLDAGSYPKRRIRVQYAETDFDFVNRLLEDIGVTYYFEQAGDDTALVLVDAPNKAAPRAPVRFVDQPNENLSHEYVTAVSTRREVRPGRYTQSDVDWRKPRHYPLASSAAMGNAVEANLERYHHNYGSFLWKAEAGGDTPVADDRGPARTNERHGARQVNRRLEAQRVDARGCTFHTSAHDLRPGKVFTMVDHPRSEVAEPLLVVGATFSGATGGGWTHTFEARYTDVDYRPPLRTPKPQTRGVEAATVTGPPGEEIHTDEFGRVRVHFHWDREGAADDTSSCWVPQSQPWAGAGFGGISLARVGQEVLVDFLGGDPDRPVVVGRVYTTTTPTPYQLPKHKMVSGHRTESYPRQKAAPPPARLGGGPVDEAASAMASAPVGVPVGAPVGGGLPLEQLGGGGFDVKEAAGTGFNEIRFDDTAGHEEIYIHAQKELNEVVLGSHSTSVGGDQSNSVGHDQTNLVKGHREHTVLDYETVTVTGDRTTLFKANEHHTVNGFRDTTIGISEKVNVGAFRDTTIGASEHLHVVAFRETDIDVSEKLIVGAFRETKIGANDTLHVGGDRFVTVDAGHVVHTGGNYASTAVTQHAFESPGFHVKSTTADFEQSSHFHVEAAGCTLYMSNGMLVLSNGAGATIALIGGLISIVAGGTVMTKAGGAMITNAGQPMGLTAPAIHLNG
jgi:type VI secretion system secreted protein VgrG